jgi:hypothetical protein
MRTLQLLRGSCPLLRCWPLLALSQQLGKMQLLLPLLLPPARSLPNRMGQQLQQLQQLQGRLQRTSLRQLQQQQQHAQLTRTHQHQQLRLPRRSKFQGRASLQQVVCRSSSSRRHRRQPASPQLKQPKTHLERQRQQRH